MERETGFDDGKLNKSSCLRSSGFSRYCPLDTVAAKVVFALLRARGIEKHMDWNDLIPELKTWASPISPDQLAASEGRYPLAIGYLTIFWPSFVEFDGMVFPEEEVDEKAVSSWLGSTKGNKQTVEAGLNHFHILHLQHPGIWRDATEAQIKFIGQTLKETWAAKLARDFPGRQFVVELIEGTSEKLEDYQVVFYQPKSTSG